MWCRSTYIARRWEEEDGINLYHLPGGFFAELYYDPEANTVRRMRAFTRVRAFTDAAPLEDYAVYVRLPAP